MKINWGTGIVIAIALFMTFILVLVYNMTMNQDYNHDLVVEEYYKKELAFQEEIDAEKNALSLSERIKGKKVKNGWLLTFPKEIEGSQIEGSVFLYRPSNKQLDFDFSIELSGLNLLIPDESLLDGRWNITVEWEYKGKPYLYKESITY
ncbi:MAG: nitrogen fixation protein FixH [Sediminicola sp.]|jgi:nitrogen fixation protein FixH|tara:strand:- start:76 stop:522 length:447 start_codon:yes stop_codon:yes gene_type:complete